MQYPICQKALRLSWLQGQDPCNAPGFPERAAERETHLWTQLCQALSWQLPDEVQGQVPYQPALLQAFLLTVELWLLPA